MPIVDMEMQFVKIQRIADDLAEHPMLRDIPFDRIINYAQELMGVIGSPKLFLDKIEKVEINNYRGVLPCDFISMIQVRGVKHQCGPDEYVATANTFHTAERKDNYISLPTYKVQGDVIITSREKDTIEVSYRAIPVDENGWPMLPDNAVFIRALEAYIKMKRFTVLFDQGQISLQVFNNAQQDYAWCVGQAETEFARPTIDEMETITNMWNRLIPTVSEHRNGFATAHNKELLRRH